LDQINSKILLFDQFIEEAISLKDARKATKIFLDSGGKARYDQIFQGKDRLYYDFIPSDQVETPKSETQKKIESFLREKGYDVVDYPKGLAVKSGDTKNKIKIQKLLIRFEQKELKNLMDADPIRFSVRKDQKKVVISRHGIDLAGQSTGRDWTSCKSLNGGMNKRYVWTEIEKGSLVAYLIEADDLNIQKPIARSLIGVFVNPGDKSDFVLYPDTNIYGNYTKSDFLDFVKNWCDENNSKVSKNYSGIYKLSPKCYADDRSDVSALGGNLDLFNFLEIYKNENILRTTINKNSNFNANEIKNLISFIGENLEKVGKDNLNNFIKKVKNFCDEKTFASVVNMNTNEKILEDLEKYTSIFIKYLINIDDLGSSFESPDKVKIIRNFFLRYIGKSEDLQEATKKLEELLNDPLLSKGISPQNRRIFNWIINK